LIKNPVLICRIFSCSTNGSFYGITLFFEGLPNDGLGAFVLHLFVAKENRIILLIDIELMGVRR